MPTSGRINLFSLALVGAIFTGMYIVVVFAPAYADDVDVREAVTAAYNSSGRQPDDELRRMIQDRLNQAPGVGTHKEDDGFGNIVERPGLGLTDEQVIIERDEVRGMISIRVEYARDVLLRPTKRIYKLAFSVRKEGPIPR